MTDSCLLCDFLEDLGVPHTDAYTRRRFEGMTFQSLFGLSKLLEEYGVESQALAIGDKEAALEALDTPFLAYTVDGDFGIVETIDAGGVRVRCCQGRNDMSRDDFLKLWSGTVLLAFPKAEAAEPSYSRHRFLEIAGTAKRVILPLAALFAAGYAFTVNGLYAHLSTILLTVIYLAGLYVTYQLLLKSIGVHSTHGDKICSLIDANGCHEVLKTDGASFFGLFSWSEVGLAYFSVSLAALLMFPQAWTALAIINACGCPFSFWSVWYQKYRAKAWCTLCLITQTCLWSALACWFFGGWFTGAFPWWPLMVLGACYVAVLLGINALTPMLNQNEEQD